MIRMIVTAGRHLCTHSTHSRVIRSLYESIKESMPILRKRKIINATTITRNGAKIQFHHQGSEVPSGNSWVARVLLPEIFEIAQHSFV